MPLHHHIDCGHSQPLKTILRHRSVRAQSCWSWTLTIFRKYLKAWKCLRRAMVILNTQNLEKFSKTWNPSQLHIVFLRSPKTLVSTTLSWSWNLLSQICDQWIIYESIRTLFISGFTNHRGRDVKVNMLLTHAIGTPNRKFLLMWLVTIPEIPHHSLLHFTCEELKNFLSMLPLK